MELSEFLIEETVWKVGKFLGKGFSSVVYEISAEGNSNCAAKFMKKPLKNRWYEMLDCELISMKKSKHPNIVDLLEDIETADYHVIRLELCSSGDMFSMMVKKKNLTEEKCIYYMKQLLKALEYLHDQNIVHRDVKSSNIYLNKVMDGDVKKYVLKLGDFGLAHCLENRDELCTEVLGTPNCIAPEVLRCSKKYEDLNRKRGYSFTGDIWSAGVCLYFWFYGKHPFVTDNIEKTYRRILRGLYRFKKNPEISENLKNFIKSILIVDEEKRPNASQLLDTDIMKK